jgi:hypothetical protein
MAIDALGCMKYIEGYGVPRAAAEALAEAADRFLFPQLVTQPDLKLAVSELRAEIASLKVWLISTVIAVAGVALAIAKLT